MISTENDFQNGYRLHQKGDMEQAAAFYHKTLDFEPEHAGATFLLGTIRIQQGDLDDACVILKKAIKLGPENVVAICNLGTALLELGKIDEAIVNFKEAIRIKPGHIDAHHNLGNAYQELDKFNLAEKSYRRALFYSPDLANTHYSLGNTLRYQGRFDEAVDCYRHTITLRPDYAEAHCNLGSSLQELGKIGEAMASYKTAITLKPDYTMAICNMGSMFQELGKIDEAMASYKTAITLKPDDTMAICNLGSTFQELGENKTAIEYYKKVLSLDPDYVMAHDNLGSALQVSGSLEGAIACYKKAIELDPDYASAHRNLGTALQEFCKIEESIECYDRAIELKPDYAEAHMNRSMALLLTERFAEGWSEYEWRLLTKSDKLRDFGRPKWDGTPLAGKTILVYADQGFGDAIQFVRYLPMVKERGGRIIFMCRRDIISLLENCSGTDVIVEEASTDMEEVQFDCYIPLLSLPGIFGTTLDTIPSGMPYIEVDPVRKAWWKTRLNHDQNFKIGIVWAGSANHKKDYMRSCLLSDFTTLADISGTSFYSLQKGPASAGSNELYERIEIINMVSELNDFADTAALISNLDLVISVDTAVVHLAGAIGTPIWTLLPFSPDWRWLLDRDRSQWYPDMRLFRQTQAGDWRGVFDQIKDELTDIRKNAKTLKMSDSKS